MTDCFPKKIILIFFLVNSAWNNSYFIGISAYVPMMDSYLFIEYTNLFFGETFDKYGFDGSLTVGFRKELDLIGIISGRR